MKRFIANKYGDKKQNKDGNEDADNNKNLNRDKYDLDGIPHLSEAIPLGLQHIFAMF